MAFESNFTNPGYDFSDPNSLASLYGTALGRAPDAAGLQFWQQGAAAGTDPNLLYQQFMTGANAENLGNSQQSQGAAAQPAQQQSGYSSSYTQNPFLDQIAGNLRDQSNTNLTNNVFPGISWGSQAAGGFGDTRQGIAEGNAIGQATQGLNTAIAGLYGNDYENSQNRNLQQYGIDSNAYAANRSLDLQSALGGASLFGQGTSGLLSQGSGIYGLGNAQQANSWSPYQNFSNLINPTLGTGGSSSSTGSVTGSTLGNAIGGAGLGYNAANYLSNSGLNNGSNSSSGYNYQNNYDNGSMNKILGIG